MGSYKLVKTKVGRTLKLNIIKSYQNNNNFQILLHVTYNQKLLEHVGKNLPWSKLSQVGIVNLPCSYTDRIPVRNHLPVQLCIVNIPCTLTGLLLGTIFPFSLCIAVIAASSDMKFTKQYPAVSPVCLQIHKYIL